MSDDYIEPPPLVSVPSLEHHEDLTAARLEGYSWPEINGNLQARAAEAYSVGYTQDEIDRHLGYLDPGPFQNRLDGYWRARDAADPNLVTGLVGVPRSAMTPLDELSATRMAAYGGLPLPPVDEYIEPPRADQTAPIDISSDSMRGAYADALLSGEVRSPLDFAERYSGAFYGVAAGSDPAAAGQAATVAHAARDLAATLPSNEDFTDVAIGLGEAGGVPLSPASIAVIKDNLAELWASTGKPLMDIYREANADPGVLDRLTLPKQEPAPWWASMLPEAALGDTAATPELPEQVMQGINDWWTWRVQQFEEGQKGRLSWDDLKKGVTSEQLMHDPAFNIAMGFAGSITPFKGKIADVLFPKVADAIKGMPEPRVNVVDLAKPEGEALTPTPATRAYEPVQPAARAPEPVTAEGTPAPKTSPAPEFVETATPAAKMEALSRDYLDRRADVMENMRLQREGFAPDEFTPNFFQRLAAGQDPQTIELARGMDTARGVGSYLRDLGGAILRDESGALNIFSTPAQRDARALRAESKEAAKDLMIRSMGKVGRQEANYGDFFDHAKLAGGGTQNLHKLTNQHMLEWEREIAKGPAGAPMQTAIGNMIEYIEGRTAGATLAHNELRPVADTIRATNIHLRLQMEDAAQRGLHSLQTYYTDYFRHMWKDPLAADRAFGVGRQGSSASFQLRTIPTVADGLARGLEPKVLNPVELTLLDASEKLRYLGTLDVLDAASKTHNLAGDPFVYFARAPKAGTADVRLNGVGTTRQTPAGDIHAYANPGFAHTYNNQISTGFFAKDTTGSLYEKLIYIKNLQTQGQLMLPFFHAQTMATEALAGGYANVVSELAGGVSKLAQGQLRAAGLEFAHGTFDLAKTVTMVPKFTETMIRGAGGIRAYNEMRAYKSINGHDLVDVLTEANARFGPRQDIYRYSRAPSLWDSWKRGSFGAEYREQLQKLIGDKSEPAAYRAFHGATDRLFGVVMHEVGRILNTTTAPLFDYVIPRLKIGVNIERMQTYLRQNPTATQEQIQKYARQIVNNTDDRMGEMNMDNIFWPKAVKQAAQLTMISPGWVYGAFRFFGNAASSLGYLATAGKAFTWNAPALTAFMGFTAALSVQHSIVQYLMSGQLPWDTDTPIKDMAMPRTGATMPGQVPERVLMPSQAKEMFDFGKIGAYSAHSPFAFPHHMFQYALGKMPGLWQIWRGLLTEHDAIGNRIENTAGGWPEFFLKNLTPIFASTMNERKKGTGIAEWQSFIGWRQVPKFAMDPEGFYKGLERMDAYHTQQQRRRARRENQIYERPREVP